MCVRDPPRAGPRIASFCGDESSTYIVFVERRELLSVTSFVKALMLWFAAHYMLNLRYSKAVGDVALLFQENIFSLPE